MNGPKEILPRILIVDDVKTNLILLSGLLDEYDVTQASNGRDAIKIASENYFDLILLDIVMPDMDGYEVCKRLKSVEATKDIPVVFATGITDEDSIDKAYKAGGVDYVTKPFKSKELLARVRTQVSFRNVKQDLEEKIALIDKYVSYSTTDTAGKIVDVSDAFCKISGYAKEELIGIKHSILRHPNMKDDTYSDLWTTITKGKKWIGEVQNLKKDGTSFWVDVVITPRYDHYGIICGYTAIRHDITYQKKVEVLSITDQLTNLYNRRYFNDVLPVEIKRAIRQGTCLSFLMLDIDYFKQYNDTYGHQDGDNVLKKLGTTLKEQAKRTDDLIFRLGGEEFGIIFTSNNAHDAKQIAQRVKESVENIRIEHKMSKISKYVTASVGLACIDFSKQQNHDLNEGKIYKMSDDELYKSKNAGRNRVSSVLF